MGTITSGHTRYKVRHVNWGTGIVILAQVGSADWKVIGSAATEVEAWQLVSRLID